MTEKTVNICGKEVKIRYCAASESMFEKLADKSISEMNLSTQEDVMRLALCCIIAAYERTGETTPVEAKDLLYDAKPKELIELYKTVFELRAAWYEVPAVVQDEMEERKESEKN